VAGDEVTGARRRYALWEPRSTAPIRRGWRRPSESGETAWRS